MTDVGIAAAFMYLFFTPGLFLLGLGCLLWLLRTREDSKDAAPLKMMKAGTYLVSGSLIVLLAAWLLSR